MTDLGPINYHTLPIGTVLTFESKLGNRIVVRIIGDVMGDSYGRARQVKVLEAPHRFDDSVQPTHMLCVPPGTDVPMMAYAYAAAKPTICVDDTVYLVDVYDESQNPRGLEVKAVTVSLPA